MSSETVLSDKTYSNGFHPPQRLRSVSGHKYDLRRQVLLKNFLRREIGIEPNCLSRRRERRRNGHDSRRKHFDDGSKDTKDKPLRSENITGDENCTFENSKEQPDENKTNQENDISELDTRHDISRSNSTNLACSIADGAESAVSIASDPVAALLTDEEDLLEPVGSVETVPKKKTKCRGLKIWRSKAGLRIVRQKFRYFRVKCHGTHAKKEEQSASHITPDKEQSRCWYPRFISFSGPRVKCEPPVLQEANHKEHFSSVLSAAEQTAPGTSENPEETGKENVYR